ncbi:MAG: tetratricopeptide repeat protein [Candidatus Electrothrix sp. AW3_4]|nr:tetratricopeptide repeat protein [Candidatus Electrothrix gigas]
MAGDFSHQSLALQGLQAGDSVDWFDSLRRLPPKSRFKRPRRDVLIKLFAKVGFHPLSISLLAQQLKQRGPAEVGERLEALLEEQPVNQADRSLLASLELSLEQLPEQCRDWLPRLGVFQGGGLEEIVVKVAGMEDYPSEWSTLRYHLERSGLMQAERVAERIWLRFHPTLALVLWQKLGTKEKVDLRTAYWLAYYLFSLQIYILDNTAPHAARTVANQELPNLLRAVHIALQVGKAEDGIDFVDNVNWFLHHLGLQRDWEKLSEAVSEIGGTVDFEAWYTAKVNLGAQLYGSSQPAAAAKIFQEILKGLRRAPSYNRCFTLGMLGRCHWMLGQPAEAERLYRQELDELAQLEQNEDVRRQTAAAWTDLADMLRIQGRWSEAEEDYLLALKIDEELGEIRGMAAITGQLGTLFLHQGYLSNAAALWRKALSLWQRMNEPEFEAAAWHQLGSIYMKEKNWESAEDAYRKAAKLKEELGLLGGINGAGNSWNRLAQLCDYSGRPGEAEQWCRKALTVFQDAGNRPAIANTLHTLAILLSSCPARLDEARCIAEECLAISETLDPAAAEIWTTYRILARIADQQGDESRAADYHAKAERAYAPYRGGE